MKQTDFERLIEGLLDPRAYPHEVERVDAIETHISQILLAGDFAYKLKKPVNLGFLDFTTLERRKFFCDEEIRLNRRLAPALYLGVEPITGSLTRPRVGGDGEALEFAVRMRRFPQEALLSRRPVTTELADRIAERVAAFHDRIPVAPSDSGYGSPPAVLGPMLDNFTHIRPCLAGPDRARIEDLAAWTRTQTKGLAPHIDRRRETGHIRECHGDMHRGNIAIVDDEVVIFDGIEFNPGLRWIDTVSEVAFLIMDLEESGHPVLARRFLNRYLQIRGDYDGLPLLALYKVYRAMVRAKVIAIRLGQDHLGADEAAGDRRELARYLALAEAYTTPRTPVLILTHGLSGSGKSSLAAALLEHLDGVQIRSDVERKRLFGLSADADSVAAVGNIYTEAASARTYQRLLEQARQVLAAGHHALVDAAFLRQAQRRPFCELAAQLGCRCRILSIQAPESVLYQRLADRRHAGQDASEADGRVLSAQLATQEPLTAAERTLCIDVDTTQAVDLPDLCARIRV